MKKIILKISTLVLSLMLALFALLSSPKLSYADSCHSKYCEVSGQPCVCCLITAGSIACLPCGAIDCDS